MDENKIFLRTIEDKYEKFTDYYSMMTSDFLSLEQQSMLSGFLRMHKQENVFLFGGYPDAERRLVLFLPDYTGVEPDAGDEEILAYFRSSPEESPLSVLAVRPLAGNRAALTHRDYLGSLMGEGIRREKIGDILVSEEGAQIIVARELGAYLSQNYRQVGKYEVSAKIMPIFGISAQESKINTLKFTVSSPRIDNIIASVYGLSRKSATEAITSGRVFVNGAETVKPDMSLKGGEKIVLRGKGKAIYHGINGTSKKGKAYITVDKYI